MKVKRDEPFRRTGPQARCRTGSSVTRPLRLLIMVSTFDGSVSDLTLKRTTCSMVFDIFASTENLNDWGFFRRLGGEKVRQSGEKNSGRDLSARPNILIDLLSECVTRVCD